MGQFFAQINTAAPPIYFSLFRNDRPIFSHVYLGDLCGNVTNVKSVDIFDGHEGWDTRNFTVCIAPKGDDAPKCHWLSDTYGAIEKAIPIDQIGLEKIRDLDQ